MLFTQICKKVKSFSKQDVGNTLWAIAKLRPIISFKNTEDVTYAIQALEERCMHLKRLNINDICNCIWAKASMTTNMLTRQSLDNVGNTKQVIHAYVQFLINSLTKSIDEISAGQVAYLIWSIGKLSKFLPSGDKYIKIFTQLCHSELKRTLASMHGQNIGMVAFGLANMPIENFVKKPNLMEIHEGMHEHIQRTIDVMTWQSIAHVDLYTRKYSNADASMKLKMNEIATNASESLSRSIKASAKELEKLIFEGFLTTELWGISEGDRCQKTVLMIDLPRRLCKKYKKKGFKVLHWNRFMEKDCEGRTWLSEKSLDAKIDGCLLGLGIFKRILRWCAIA